MTTDIEQRLRDALQAEARLAPELSEESCTVANASITEHGNERSIGSRSWLLVAAVVAVALGTAAVLSRSPGTVVSTEDPASEESSLTFEPDGVEIVLSPSIEAVTIDEIAKPGSLSRFVIEGHPDNVVFETLVFDPFLGNVARIICHFERGSGGCGGADSDFRSTPNVSLSSSVDNGVADTNVVSWIDLPDEVAFVTYNAASGQQWQRPVGGSVFFVHDQAMSMTALDAEGATLATMPPSDTPTDVPPTEFWGEQDGWNQDGMEALDSTARTTFRECLERNGAVFDEPNVPSFESDQIADEVWDACEIETNQAVELKRAELELPPPTG